MARLTEVLEGLLSHTAGMGRSGRTLEFYTDTLTPFITYCASRGIEDIERCTRPLVWEFLTQLPVQHSTKNAYVRAIKRLGRFAVEEEYVSSSPLERLKAVKEPQRVRKTLSLNELERFLAACQGENKLRDRALALFLYDTGCRFGEIQKLTLGRLYLKERYALVEGKGSRERLVAFSPRTADALFKYLRRRPKSYCEEVFLTRKGTPLTNDIAHVFGRIGKRAGLEKSNPHLFRHSAATELLRHGLPTETVRKLLGHSSVATTQTYLHLMAQDVIDAHKRGSPVMGKYE